MMRYALVHEKLGRVALPESLFTFPIPPHAGYLDVNVV